MRSKREIDSIVGIFFISRCFLNGWQNKEECTELIINQVLIFFFPSAVVAFLVPALAENRALS